MPLDQRVIRRPQFSDPEVCKHALAGLCPFGERPDLACWLAGQRGMAGQGVLPTLPTAPAAASGCCVTSV